MKLRIQANSLRLRISRSDLTKLAATGSLEETIFFGTDPGSRLTYMLAGDGTRSEVDVESEPGSVRVLLPTELLRTWVATDQVGIAADVVIAAHGNLSILVEKDFACLDRTEKENADTFPHPVATSVC